MRITKLELENFKRFTKLTIDMSQLSTPPKLVLLIGANGSGKSSVFDAFNYLKNASERDDYPNDFNQYFSKDPNLRTAIALYKNGQEMFAGLNNKGNTTFVIPPKYFYGRTSLRQIPRLTRLAIKNGFNVENDTDRPLAWIDRDERFENDVEKTTLDIQKLLFDVSKTVSNQEIIKQYINPINDAISRIFNGGSKTTISYLSIIPPGDGHTAELLFKKGESIIDYNLLSSGEKEIFNILLNLSVRGKYYQDTIYFIDEMDLHLEYTTQKAFLKEIVENWIPENCQLWTASHSLGFIQYANENENAAIIDLDNLDFDIEQTIIPSPKNTSEVFEIAVSKEFLGQVFKGKRIVFAKNLDTEIYNAIGVTDTIFAKANDKNDVFFKSRNLDQLGLADRDYLTDDEVNLLKEKYPFLRILGYYSIENYLYHPQNLNEYYLAKGLPFDINKYQTSLAAERDKNLTDIAYGIQQARNGYPFFKENENQKQYKLFREQGSDVLNILKDPDFDTFYKVFPAKDYGKTLPERQNLSKHELGRTKWFKLQIEKVLEK